METQQYNSADGDLLSTPKPNSLASSVLHNIFSRNGLVQLNNEPLPPAISDTPNTTDKSKPSASTPVQAPVTSELVREVLNRFDARKERAAVELGIAANEIESLPFDLSALESEGIFMNIDCRGFGMLVRQLEWKTLGVKLPEHAAVRVSPPRAGLLPDVYRNKLMRGQAQAHNALAKYGFRFTLCETVWGTNEYKWIPWGAFEEFEQAYFRACETLAAAKAEVLEKYDEIAALLVESFRKLAEDSAERLQATVAEPFERLEFVEAVVAQALNMVPTREMIRDGLVITMKPKVIVLGSEMIAEKNLARGLSLETAKVDAEHAAIALELDSTQITR